MNDAANDVPAGQRDRSPAFPNMSLESALKRLEEFEAHFKRSPARPDRIGDAWNIKGKAYVDRSVAALKYFGLLEYQGSGPSRQVVVSEEGRRYLRAQQEGTRREVIKSAALRPKQIAHFWERWGADRPANAACIDELTLENGFSDGGARDFLNVYDATISFAGLPDSDKVISEHKETDEAAMPAIGQSTGNLPLERRHTSEMVAIEPQFHPAHHREVHGERELTSGILSKNIRFRLLVNGPVGTKEIERLIKKLELDKEILADADDNDEHDNHNGE